jgi:hypothetical protein
MTERVGAEREIGCAKLFWSYRRDIRYEAFAEMIFGTKLWNAGEEKRGVLN